ncbi:TY-Chap domain-containing protein [Actinomadura gamaensis]|uniref:TY-Chap N-terminal domain-containing protein n=1 Tax=Actinomadura gamaensis TaxID=1763541 RepID=A0ABV9TUC5_9ACTN
MAPTSDQLPELARRFAALDMTGWDDAAFDRAVTHLGWRRTQDGSEGGTPLRTDREEYETGLGTGPGLLARHGSDDERTGISVRVGEAGEFFPRLRAALEDALGAPSIMRGPGPLLRWRGPVRLLELERLGDDAYLRIVPTEAVENDEYRTAKWAEPEDGLEQLGYWQIVGRGPELAGLFLPGGYYAEDWAEFENRLATTFSSILNDFSLLEKRDDFTVVVRTPGEHGFVQWTTDRDWGLHIEAAIPPDHDPAWRETMTGLGWPLDDTPEGEFCVADDFSEPGTDEANIAARMLVGALKSYGFPFEDLWYERISRDPDLLGIGLPTRHGDRF